jgi:serine/threonine-protein kinase HipA
MSEQTAHVALGDRLTPVGLLRFTRTGPRQFSTFSYDPTWRDDPRAFAIQPGYDPDGGPYHASGAGGDTREALAGVFMDCAPESWGRRLLERAYGGGLSEFDYLTLSDDFTRQGALRFLDADRQIIRGDAPHGVPRLIDLEVLTSIARGYEQGKDVSAEDIRALAGAGGSGGARPKANIQDEGALWLAKFTSALDQQPVERVEVATLALAKACGIRTPEARLELADTDFPVALIRRFDRGASGRIPYISARTALGKDAGALGSYTEIVDFMRTAVADPEENFRELYRRMIFTILVSNKDDHLKNHGFLYVGEGRWRLSHMFDVNPAPDRNPHLETAIVEGGPHDRSIALALEAAAFFELREDEARTMIREMAVRISDEWRPTLQTTGVTGADARGYEPAFVHEEIKAARKL